MFEDTGFLNRPPLREAYAPQEKKQMLKTPEETMLETREAIGNKELYGGSNVTRLLEMKDDGKAVFKPREGEEETRDNIEAGTYYKRERAAYLVDQALGFGLVPTTVIREEAGQLGSCQQFVEGATIFDDDMEVILKREYGGKSFLDLTRAESAELKKKVFDANKSDFQKLYIYDLITWNSDRHVNNYLIQNGRVVAIDQGLTFGDDYPRFLYEYIDEPIDPEIIDKLRVFQRDASKKTLLHEELGELLKPEEVEACFKRLDQVSRILFEHGRIPKNMQYDITF